MYLSRMMLRTNAPFKSMHGSIDPEYALHKAIWEAFSDSPDRERDFIYRLDYGSMDRPVVYTLSEREPVQNGHWSTQSKEFAPRIASGDRLAFRLRVNPVVSRAESLKQRGKRHDVVMDLKRRKRQALGSNGTVQMDSVVHEAGIEWLEKKGAKHGFGFDSDMVRVETYRQHVLKKRQGRKPVRFSSLDFAGRLIVEEQVSFLRAVAEGLGPAKGFGMGLMLLRRV